MPRRFRLLAASVLVLLTAAVPTQTAATDPVVVAKIREEGLQRSQVMVIMASFAYHAATADVRMPRKAMP